MTAVLYQFPVSHYCEKARWALDVADVPYEVKNIAFFEHMVVVPRLSGGSRTVPVLVDGTRVLDDSSDILRFAAHRAPMTLFPTSEPGRTEVESLLRHFDDVVGPAVRTCAYADILVSLDTFTRVAFTDLDPTRRKLSKLAAPLFRPALRRAFGIPRRVPKMTARLLDAATELDRRLEDREYLVGDAFTAADLTGAALWAPLLAVPGTPWFGRTHGGSGEAARLGESLRDRPIGRWVMRMYERHRVRRRVA